jgi:hypothetical protein
MHLLISPSVAAAGPVWDDEELRSATAQVIDGRRGGLVPSAQADERRREGLSCCGRPEALVLALLSLLSVARAEAPEVPGCSILSPTFKLGEKSHAAGTAFALKHGDKTLLVTAHHLLGPGGGLAVQITGLEVPTQVSLVVARDSFTGEECARTENALRIMDASPMSQAGGTKDVAAFVVKVATGLDRLSATPKTPLATRTLAAAAPKVGDTVWVAARFKDREDKLFPAEVVESSDESLFYKFADATLALDATSGAAVIDGDGAVVGIQLGGGKMADGALIGSANPLASVKMRLEAALSGG